MVRSQTEAFDYIVVGGGSAGCVVAARLSEDPRNTVLLLEAGPDNRRWIVDMPAAVSQILTDKRYMYHYQTAPEPFIGGKLVHQPRGRVLGGSSSVNGMVFTRGNPGDFDKWETKYGCTGWGYRDVLPYFKRFETSDFGETEYRGGSGPLKISVPAMRNPIFKAWLDAGRQAGYPVLRDSNSASQEGFAPHEQTIAGGYRVSTAYGYLTATVRRRPNLEIRTDSPVERLLFEGDRAVAVDYVRNDRRGQASAAREIILCGGSVNTPKLLMQSGVGDAEALRTFGISVVHDLPGVGANLQDHPDVAIHVASKDPSVTIGRAMLFPRKQAIGLRWFISKSGPAATNHYEACAFLRSRPGLAEPNIKFELFPAALKPDSFELYPEAAFQMNIGVMTVASRGKISLSGPNPSDAPILVVNYLKELIDRQSHREAVRIARNILSQPAMADYAGTELDPGPAIQSDEQLDSWINERCASCFHLAGSCRMGPASDPETVVGVDLKVHGVRGLRIADASIMPEIVSANTNATSIMIGERAASLIIEA